MLLLPALPLPAHRVEQILQLPFQSRQSLDATGHVLPRCGLEILDEGLTARDQVQPLCVMGNSSFENGRGTSQFAGPPIQLLGLIHFVTAGSWKAEQGIRLLLETLAFSAGGQTVALIAQCCEFLGLPALKALNQLLAGPIQLASVEAFSIPVPQLQGQIGLSG